MSRSVASDMKDEDRLKTWTVYGDISRKWVTVMDAKAGFVSALNVGLIGFLWAGAKLSDGEGAVRYLAIAATIGALVSLITAISAVLPRESLSTVFQKSMGWSETYRPLSYYGFIAAEYAWKDFQKLKTVANSQNFSDLADEALEQHFVLSHAITRKSGLVKLAGILLLVAITLAAIALITRLS